MNIYKYYLLKVKILPDSDRSALNLSDHFPSLYLRRDNFPKNYAKVVVLLCPYEISIANLRYHIFFNLGLNLMWNFFFDRTLSIFANYTSFPKNSYFHRAIFVINPLLVKYSTVLVFEI